MGSGLGPAGAEGGLDAGVPEDVAAHPSFRAPTCAVSSGRVASPPFSRRPTSLPAEGDLSLTPCATVESRKLPPRRLRGCKTRQLKPGEPGRGPESRAGISPGRFPPGNRAPWPRRRALAWPPASSCQRPRAARAGAAFFASWGPQSPETVTGLAGGGEGCKRVLSEDPAKAAGPDGSPCLQVSQTGFSSPHTAAARRSADAGCPD